MKSSENQTELKNGYDNNMELLKLAQSGDESAVEELMQSNMGLVRSIVQRFRDRGTETEDLIQIGSIGMLKAIRSFDFERGTVFSTYAVPLIIGEIRRFLRDDGMIKVGRSQKRRGIELMRARDKFIAENNREPLLNELSEMCGMTPQEAAAALDASSPVHSLSETIAGDEDYTLDQTIADENSGVENTVEQIALAQALEGMPILWRKIVLLRYFRDCSQQETADKLGLTQVKVSREEKKIFEHLKKQLSG